MNRIIWLEDVKADLDEHTESEVGLDYQPLDDFTPDELHEYARELVSNDVAVPVDVTARLLEAGHDVTDLS